mgnify:CR=1 FL=1
MKQPMICPTCEKMGYIKIDADTDDFEISWSAVEPYDLRLECGCTHCGTEFDERYEYKGPQVNVIPEDFKKDEENIP